MPGDTKALKIVPGTLIAERYRVTRPIGRGGMAQVFEASHVDIGKRVAIKILSAEFANSTIVVERFLREARAAAAVRSPYICDVFDSGKLDDGRPFLVMELLEGESLYERMVRVRLFDAKTTLRIVTHTARGLVKAHAANIVHRDLKPENIFLTTNEDGELHAKILDFGLAKFYASAEGGNEARLTREGAIFGTPAYMSPEQVKGQGNVDHRADVWALGCIVYECFTGRTVWATDQGIAMTFAQIASAPIPKITKYRPDLPPTLDGWLEHALNRDIEARYQNPKDLAEGLAEALENKRAPLDSVSKLYPEGLDLTPLAPSSGLGPRSSGAVPPSSDRTGGHAPVPAASGAVPALSEAARGTNPSSLSNLVTVEAYPTTGPVPSAADMASAATERPPPPTEILRPHVPSLVDIATSNTVKGSMAPPPRPNRALRAVLTVGALAGLGVGGWFAWDLVGPKLLSQGHLAASGSGSAASSSSSLSSATSSGSTSPLEPATNVPRWASLAAVAQQQLVDGQFEGAVRGFKEAFDAGGSPPARNLYEQIAIASSNKGPCKLAALGRIRPMTMLGGSVSRPVLLRTGSSLLGLWSDDHESAGHPHVYVVKLDDALRPVGTPIDATPEARDVTHFSATVVQGKVALAYGQTGGPNVGLFYRQLDAEGVIASPETRLAGNKAASAWLDITATPRGDKSTTWVSWNEERDTDGDDLMLRQIDAKGAMSPEVRLTDLAKGKIPKSKISWPQIGATASTLEVMFKLERDTTPGIQLVHLLQADPDLASNTLQPVRGPRVDRFIGAMQRGSAEREKADQAKIACNGELCFATWTVERGPGVASGGAVAAQLDPTSGRVLWQKKFAPNGTHPTVGINARGNAFVAWFEAGKIKIAPLAREGVGQINTLGRIAGDQPRGDILVTENANELTLSWIDFESGRLEPYALRATCQ
ncbi:MAG: protein kinase [Polyangiaceae bacterium]